MSKYEQVLPKKIFYRRDETSMKDFTIQNHSLCNLHISFLFKKNLELYAQLKDVTYITKYNSMQASFINQSLQKSTFNLLPTNTGNRPYLTLRNIKKCVTFNLMAINI